VYFVNGKFGITWRLHQALVKPKASISGKCFINLTPDEVTRLNTATVETDTLESSEVSSGGGVEIVASDEEEEPEEEIAKDPEPVVLAVEEPDAKKVVKKRVIRRKE
jgi:hypothetical protein